MSDDKRMTIDGRRTYLRKIQKRYRKAKRAELGGLLDEMEHVTKVTLPRSGGQRQCTRYSGVQMH